MRIRGFLVPCLTALALVACGEPSPEPQAPGRRGPPLVAVTIAPLQYVAARLGGDAVVVAPALPEGADPAFWRPTPEAIAALQAADLVVVNGARHERWLGVVSLPRTRLVETASGLREPLIQVVDGAEHTHGTGGAHSHAGVNGHTWVDPTNLRAQATAVRDALIRLVPTAAEAITTRHVALDADLAALAAGFAALPPLGDDEVLVASHPAYDYLARRLGWTMVNLDWVPDAVPRTGALDALVGRLQGRHARAMLWEATPSPAAVDAVAQRLGVPSLVFDPGETLTPADRAAGRDWLAVQRDNLERLRTLLAGN